MYRSYGFAAIDTPALEYTEILLGNGGREINKQLYRFTDHGDRDVALRFDLTVPLARFVAQHIALSSARRSSATTSPRSGAARTRSAAATASSCSATSTPSARDPNAADIETRW